MPKKEQQKDCVEELPRIENFYLKRRNDEPGGIIYLHEYDENTGKAPGRSLRTRDVEVAKVALYEVALLNAKPPEEGKVPTDCLVLDAVNYYCEKHAPETSVHRLIEDVRKFCAEKFPEVRLREIMDPIGQKVKLIQPMREIMRTFKNGKTRRRFKDVSINTYVGYIFTALEYYKGAGFLAAVPDMLPRKKWGPDLRGRKRLLSDPECGKLFDTAGDWRQATGDWAEWMDMVLAFGTVCRPGRTKKARRCMVDYVHQSLNLLQPGEVERPNKRHPTIRMCPTLMYWLKKFERENEWDYYCARPDGTVGTSCSTQRRIARNSGVPDYIPYHRRHKSSTVMREEAVMSIEKDVMMGHEPEGSGTGHNYSHTTLYHPDYLINAAVAMEALFRRVARHTRHMLVPTRRELEEMFPREEYPEAWIFFAKIDAKIQYPLPTEIEEDQPEPDTWLMEPSDAWGLCRVAARPTPPPVLPPPGVLHYNVTLSAVTPHFAESEFSLPLYSIPYERTPSNDVCRYGAVLLDDQELTKK